VGVAGLMAIAVWSILSAAGNTLHGLICSLLAVALYIFNLFDAHAGVYRQIKTAHPEKIPRIQKDPWFAVFLSRILPGLGHLYAEKFLVGGLIIASFIIFASVADKVSFLLFMPSIITAFASYNAFHLFHRKILSSKKLLWV
jgi:signal peptidase I